MTTKKMMWSMRDRELQKLLQKLSNNMFIWRLQEAYADSKFDTDPRQRFWVEVCRKPGSGVLAIQLSKKYEIERVEEMELRRESWVGPRPLWRDNADRD